MYKRDKSNKLGKQDNACDKTWLHTSSSYLIFGRQCHGNAPSGIDMPEWDENGSRRLRCGAYQVDINGNNIVSGA